MSWYEDENPNQVSRAHFELAIDLAEKCKPEWPGKMAPKVGAVVIRKGEIIAQAYRNQIGSGDHAEYIALEQRRGDRVDFKGTDLITTLEPCTEKRHGKMKKPCVDWVRYRRIRKVWIGVLDRNPRIRGKAVMRLHDLGIYVGWFPDDLVPRILAQNEEFFEHARRMTPQLTADELEARRKEVQDLALHELSAYERDLKTIDLPPQLKQLPMDSIQSAINALATMNLHDVDEWAKVGWDLLSAHVSAKLLLEGHDQLPFRTEMVSEILQGNLSMDEIESSSGRSDGRPPTIAPAGRAFTTAMQVDSTNTQSIIGKSAVFLLMDEPIRAMETLEIGRNYIATPNSRVVHLYRDIGVQLRKIGNVRWRLAYDRAKDFE